MTNILAFHGVGLVPRSREPGEERYWLEKERFLRILDLLAKRNDVELSFDDGNISDLEIALPALMEREMRATFFLVCDWVGSSGFLNVADIHVLVKSGMEIGYHGLSHHRWRKLSTARLYEEVVIGRRKLEDRLGFSLTTVACPYGSYGRRSLVVCRRANFRKVFTCDRIPTSADSWLRHRTLVFRDQDTDTMREVLDSQLGFRHTSQLLRIMTKRILC